jgi:tetratricopeptide (TPR) repeat protein
MNSRAEKRLRLCAAVAALAAALAAAPAGAQSSGSYPQRAYTPAPYREDPGSALARYLKMLAAEPHNVLALTGAARAALDAGDAQAALTFFARAEELAPRDGRIKAGMGAAFVQMEQPDNALKMFNEAAALGAPEGEFAKDRGLAYDIAGDQRRAQADYALALRYAPDAETTRRYALSLAISGDGQRALALLEDQLRQQDRAAWRTRAFVLALTGYADEAARAADSALPGQGAAMRPFFARLPMLRPADRALAVNFGHFPADAGAIQVAEGSAAYTAPQPPYPSAPSVTEQGQSALASRHPAPEPVSAAPRRRPGEAQLQSAERKSAPVARAALPRRIWVQLAKSADRSRLMAEFDRLAARSPKLLAGKAAWTATARNSNLLLVGPFRNSEDADIFTQQLADDHVDASPWTSPAGEPVTKLASLELADAAPAPAPAPSPSPPPPPPQPEARAVEPAPVQATHADAHPLPSWSRQPAPKPPAAHPAPHAAVPIHKNPPPHLAAAKPAAKKTAAKPSDETDDEDQDDEAAAPTKKGASASHKADAAKPKAASRFWVQVAGGADRDALVDDYARLKRKAPKLLGTRTAWTTPLNATNRLLVGPFKSEEEAQDFVNSLAELHLSAFTWKSPAGQEIVKLSGK